jgi:hypothetical protein
VSATIAYTGTTAVGAAARAYYIRGLSLGAARKAFRKTKDDESESGDGSGGKTDSATDSATETDGSSGPGQADAVEPLPVTPAPEGPHNTAKSGSGQAAKDKDDNDAR